MGAREGTKRVCDVLSVLAFLFWVIVGGFVGLPFKLTAPIGLGTVAIIWLFYFVMKYISKGFNKQ